MANRFLWPDSPSKKYFRTKDGPRFNIALHDAPTDCMQKGLPDPWTSEGTCPLWEKNEEDTTLNNVRTPQLNIAEGFHKGRQVPSQVLTVPIFTLWKFHSNFMYIGSGSRGVFCAGITPRAAHKGLCGPGWIFDLRLIWIRAPDWPPRFAYVN